MPDDEKGRPLGDYASRAIRRYREGLRLPYTELAQRLVELGRPIPVLGLRRIERGERRVDVDDLAALAKALGVPPVLLLFPVGIESSTEVLPGRVIDTWRALKWFTGEAPFTGEESLIQSAGRPVRVLGVDDAELEHDLGGWNRGGLIVELFRDHQARTIAWAEEYAAAGFARQRAERAETESARSAFLAEAAQHDRNARLAELRIRDVRQQIRQYRGTPPRLHPDLAHIDEMPSDDTRHYYPGLAFSGERDDTEN